MSEMAATPLLTAAEAERLAKNPGGLREDEPPFVRFVEGTMENRNESIRLGRTKYEPILKVFIRARGDNKCEVVDIAKGWKIESQMIPKEVTKKVRRNEIVDGEMLLVEREITEIVEEEFQSLIPTTPWMDKLRERLRNGQISERYFNYCQDALERFEKNREGPIDGTPVIEWNQISLAMQKNLLELGINTVELAAEMTEEAMDALGMGARDVKKKAQAYIKTSDEGAVSAQITAMQSEFASERSAYEEKLAELEERLAAQESAPKKRGPGRPRKNESTDDS